MPAATVHAAFQAGHSTPRICLDTPSSRDDNGRFAPGNSGGPGRPPGRTNALQRAAEEAITPEHLSAVMRRALRMALEGNLSAIRFIAERTLGRAAEMQPTPEPLPLDLPRMRTAADCDLAMQKIVEAIVNGALTESAAKLMLDAVTTRMKSIELTDHERRLAEIERAAASVELPGSSRRDY